jgi:hypothetical protein
MSHQHPNRVEAARALLEQAQTIVDQALALLGDTPSGSDGWDYTRPAEAVVMPVPAGVEGVPLGARSPER